jgi:hypothetical protein
MMAIEHHRVNSGRNNRKSHDFETIYLDDEGKNSIESQQDLLNSPE